LAKENFGEQAKSTYWQIGGKAMAGSHDFLYMDTHEANSCCQICSLMFPLISLNI